MDSKTSLGPTRAISPSGFVPLENYIETRLLELVGLRREGRKEGQGERKEGAWEKEVRGWGKGRKKWRKEEIKYRVIERKGGVKRTEERNTGTNKEGSEQGKNEEKERKTKEERNLKMQNETGEQGKNEERAQQERKLD